MTYQRSQWKKFLMMVASVNAILEERLVVHLAREIIEE